MLFYLCLCCWNVLYASAVGRALPHFYPCSIFFVTQLPTHSPSLSHPLHTLLLMYSYREVVAGLEQPARVAGWDRSLYHVGGAVSQQQCKVFLLSRIGGTPQVCVCVYRDVCIVKVVKWRVLCYVLENFYCCSCFPVWGQTFISWDSIYTTKWMSWSEFLFSLFYYYYNKTRRLKELSLAKCPALKALPNTSKLYLLFSLCYSSFFFVLLLVLFCLPNALRLVNNLRFVFHAILVIIPRRLLVYHFELIIFLPLSHSIGDDRVAGTGLTSGQKASVQNNPRTSCRAEGTLLQGARRGDQKGQGWKEESSQSIVYFFLSFITIFRTTRVHSRDRDFYTKDCVCYSLLEHRICWLGPLQFPF